MNRFRLKTTKKLLKICQLKIKRIMIIVRYLGRTLIKGLHVKLFSKEYDFMYENNIDANKRRFAENSMCNKYIKRIKDKREKLEFFL